MATLFTRSVLRAATKTPRLTFPKASSSPANFTLQMQRPASLRFESTSPTPPLFAEPPRLRVGSEAPNFRAKTTVGDIDFHEFINKEWVVLFSYPADFTPVSATELDMLARLRREFRRRGVKLLGLSTDDLASHNEFIDDVDSMSTSSVQFPLIADTDGLVAYLYGMADEQELSDIDEKHVTLRSSSLFLIDPGRKIRFMMSYPACTGRNTAELLRVIDSLQTAQKMHVVTPVDWHIGQEYIVPPHAKSEDVKHMFGSMREVKPYLRYVRDRGGIKHLSEITRSVKRS
ncbi:mitochondrial peroxiredoxin PRX1 [Jackrogersella minutella]|nr:mitochondrial peroxiredoxin PRX1 [Jackrogersella minutella]